MCSGGAAVIVFGIFPSLLSESNAEDHSPEYLLVGRRPSFDSDSRTALGSAVTFSVAPGWIAVAVMAMEAAREMNFMFPGGAVGLINRSSSFWAKKDGNAESGQVSVK